ncbi:putative Cytochrome P450 52A11 [Seiridium cardinale]|uniref:Cytochrome P450 52A11 n=1 Tax=Seiridium cardinale TaxID=138064 RepID=A0ABR2XD25_9PEZI
MLELLLLHWPTVLLAAIPLIGLLISRSWKSGDVDFKQYAHFPQPEERDEKRGHWPWIEKSAAVGDPRRSFDIILYEQAQKLGFPPVLLVDWRPMEPLLILFILDNTVAEQVTKTSKQFSTSIPKHPAMQDLAPLVGSRSLVTLDGDEWKGLRKRILPGFQPQHLLSLVKVILDKSKLFIEHLEKRAESGEEFRVDELTTNLAFDVIGIVTFDMELNAQIPGKQSPVLLTYRELSHAYIARDVTKHWLRRYFTENERKIRRLDKKLDVILKENIQKEHAKIIRGDATASRSVATLSLHGIEKLTPEILQQTSDTCRGFLFAGHDTTSILMQWAFYELSRSPSALKALRDELDGVFGPDPNPSAVTEQLLGPGNGELLNRLKYTDAIIKETLRLYPPGTTARLAPQGSGTTLTLPNGEKLVVDGLVLTPRALIIQRDPKIFGETKDDFVPERWLGPEAANIPESCWRPYERGPRRCTGSELANMEVKVVLACIARRFDWVKVGLGELDADENGQPILNEKGYYKTKSEIFTVGLPKMRSCRLSGSIHANLFFLSDRPSHRQAS